MQTTQASTKQKKSIKQTWEENQLYGYFKWQTKEISHEIIWTYLRQGNLNSEIKSPLIAAQINAIGIKARIAKTQ